MSKQAVVETHAHDSHGHGDEDPMSHVPPGSIWPLFVAIALLILPFGTLIQLGALKFDLSSLSPKWHAAWDVPQAWGLPLLVIGGIALLFSLMGWAHQIIREKAISHDLRQQQSDLKQFTFMFLVGEFSVFGAIFGYFYHRKIWDPAFGPTPGLEIGGAMVAYATFILIFSSVTCEVAHRCLEHGRRGWAKALLVTTILLGTIFLGFQAFEYGALIQRGFTPAALADTPSAAFCSLFFSGTGFHGLHVAIGLVMLFMVLLRLEAGHFQGSRHFSAIAASWYWHFVDIVWVMLFITIYVVA